MSGILNNVYNNLSFALAVHSQALARLQEQASTGSRINRPSDDPDAAYRVLGLNSQYSSLQNYMDTLAGAMSTLEISSSALDGMVAIIGEVRVDLTQIVSGVYDQQARERTAEVVDSALEQLVQLANTRHIGQYVFGGGNSGSAPYVVQRTNGQITSVAYQGSYQDRDIAVAPGVQSSALSVGEEIFRSSSRSEPVFIGQTGAKAGTGTSSVTGDVWLTVTHDGSNYQISIDDGASFVTVPAGGDANQAVTDSRTGKVLYVDTTGLSATGVDLVRVPGTYDIFNTLISIRDILENDRNLSEAQLQEVRNSALSSLEEIMNLVVQTQVSIGSRIEFLSNLEGSLEKMKFDTEDETTRLTEADIAQIAIDLSRREVLYQMSLSVAGRLMSLSLLDFIQ